MARDAGDDEGRMIEVGRDQQRLRTASSPLPGPSGDQEISIVVPSPGQTPTSGRQPAVEIGLYPGLPPRGGGKRGEIDRDRLVAAAIGGGDAEG